ncbi:MAG: DUF6503 family protein [Bacteroidota bacterium]
MKNINYMLLSVIFLACGSTPNVDEIVNNAIATSGGDLFEKTEIQFEFRDREYGYKKADGNFEYIRLFEDSSRAVRDILTNGGFTREVDGIITDVPDTMAIKYSNSVNSVIYFALLPYGLNDPAVNKSYLGPTTLDGKQYHKIKVTFNQKGGGEDYQDIFIYWIDVAENKVDYLAYSYETEGGGIRFRAAYNERFINGIRFVDYVNYKPQSDVVLEEIDNTFERGELEELSKIELTGIKVNKL